MKKKGSNLWQFSILLGLLVYLFAGNMISVFSVFVPFRDYLKVLIAATGLVCMLQMLNLRKLNKRNCLFPLFFLALLIIPTTFFYQTATGNMVWAVNQLGEALCWIAVFTIAYRIGLNTPSLLDRVSPIAACLIPIFAILFTGVKAFSAGRGIALISTAYYTLYMMPFALASKNKLIKWGGVFFTLYTLLLSLKRTGFIAFAAAMILFFVVTYRQSKRSSKHRLYIFISAIVALAIIVAYTAYSARDTYSVLDRLAAIKDDGGAGRNIVWQETIKMICNSDIIQLLFGHGFNAVYGDSVLQMSAHNDILETVYDYGFLGLALYLGFYKRLLLGYKDVLRKMPDFAAPFAASIIMTVPMTLFAHLIIYPTHFLAVCLFWGMLMGSVDSGEERSKYLRC